ncbi:MAG: OmpA family protein [Reichenbachiella sp.]|uniref:OmpA family protein n=1 Tax=Reichenbachiella sp. TaxID=2184521 RepID=UPI002967250E|nr:OmpA family protein [Reichenbachiella sp.]MDW3208862.1 OmpA family protein [Reichenbachiella sp.]
MKQLAQLLLLLFFLTSTLGISAQNPEDPASGHKAYKKGVRLFKNGNYVKAEEQFQMLLDSGYRDHDLIAYQAQVHLELHEPHAAKDVLLLAKDRTQDLDYLLAISHYYLEEFEEAFVELSFVTDTATYHVKEMHDRIENVMHHYHDAQGYVVQNFGPEVNTKFREYAPVMYDGFSELLFTSRNDSSEYTAHDGLAFEAIHDTRIDSLNKWHVADPFEFHTNHEQRHDATVQVYRNHTKLITFHDGQLFKSHRVGNVWEEDGPLELHADEVATDTHCHITDDESSIIFASDFHTYGHNLDLFTAYKLEDGTWSEPEPIAELNTDFDEDSPFLADDSTLYFSSRGHGSLGGYDVFKTTYDKTKKKWNKPINLDYPINTVAEDIYFSTYGKVGFISSTRNGGYGSLDLYRILLFNEILIGGTITDEKTKEPVPNAAVEIAYDSLYFRTYTDKNGKYEIYAPVNKNMKITVVDGDRQLSQGEYFLDVFFREEDNLGFDLEIPSEGAVASAAAGPQLIHVEMKNDFEEKPYIKSIAKDEISSWSDSLKNHYEKVRIAHAPPGPGTVTVYLEFNSTELSSSVKEVLDELYKDLLKTGRYRVEISGHTDPKGPMAYNQKLSERRAKVVADYMFEHGFDAKKAKVVGYGETKLIDKTNSEEADAKNRRVEIRYY